MMAVAVMHEHVHQRAGEQQEEGQIPQRMDAVLREQKKGHREKKADGDDAAGRAATKLRCGARVPVSNWPGRGIWPVSSCKDIWSSST